MKENAIFMASVLLSCLAQSQQDTSSISMNEVIVTGILPTSHFIGTSVKSPYDLGPDEQAAFYTVDLFIAYEVNKLKLFAEFHNITNQ